MRLVGLVYIYCYQNEIPITTRQIRVRYVVSHAETSIVLDIVREKLHDNETLWRHSSVVKQLPLKHQPGVRFSVAPPFAG